eukprot:1161753-Pelagomonas_calceolata.AAC.2
MSEKDSRKRVKMGQNGGLDDNNEYVVLCTLCQSSFQCRAVCVNMHEKSKKHKNRLAAWQQAQKDKAAWQQRLGKGAEYTAQQRMSSAMEYLKNPQRNSLKEQHLTACARMFKSKEFSIASFPYPTAIGKWLDASKRGRYGLDR